MNVGIVDIDVTEQCCVLRIRHGQPQAVFALVEIPAVIAALRSAEKQLRQADFAQAEACLACQPDDDGADLV